MFNEQNKMIWFIVSYETKDEPGVKKWTYIRADNPREAESVAKVRLSERYVEVPTILEIKAI